MAKSLLLFIVIIFSIQESNNLKDNTKSFNWTYWKKTYLEKNKVLVNRYTWDIIYILSNIKPISGCWVFKVKSVIIIENNNNNNNNTTNSYIINKDNIIYYKSK